MDSGIPMIRVFLFVGLIVCAASSLLATESMPALPTSLAANADVAKAFDVLSDKQDMPSLNAFLKASGSARRQALVDNNVDGYRDSLLFELRLHRYANKDVRPPDVALESGLFALQQLGSYQAMYDALTDEEYASIRDPLLNEMRLYLSGLHKSYDPALGRGKRQRGMLPPPPPSYQGVAGSRVDPALIQDETERRAYISAVQAYNEKRLKAQLQRSAHRIIFTYGGHRSLYEVAQGLCSRTPDDVPVLGHIEAIVNQLENVIENAPKE